MSKQRKQTKMDSYKAVGLAEGFIEGTADEQRAAWQFLHDTRLAYQLQGSFGRQAQRLLADGLIHETPERREEVEHHAQ